MTPRETLIKELSDVVKGLEDQSSDNCHAVLKDYIEVNGLRRLIEKFDINVDAVQYLAKQSVKKTKNRMFEDIAKEVVDVLSGENLLNSNFLEEQEVVNIIVERISDTNLSEYDI